MYWLCSWNCGSESEYRWAQEAEKECQAVGFFAYPWSTGGATSLKPGDRLFLIRQTWPPHRGIAAIGEVTSMPGPGKHWIETRAAQGDEALYVGATWRHFFADPIIKEGDLETTLDAAIHWTTQRSGIRVRGENDEQRVERGDRIWSDFLRRIPERESVPGPDELQGAYDEGASKRVFINRYERDPSARRACLEHFGYVCSVCDVTLADIYGSAADQLIHVHHIVPLATIRAEYCVNAVEDLRPVCPNCHAVIHRKDGRLPYTIEEVRAMLQARRDSAAQAAGR